MMDLIGLSCSDNPSGSIHFRCVLQTAEAQRIEKEITNPKVNLTTFYNYSMG